MESIENEIRKLVQQNDKGMELSKHQEVISILEALNEIAEQLANINQAINNRP